MSEPSAPTPTSRSPHEAETKNVSTPVAAPERDITNGAPVSRYVMLEEIGRGGMGRVVRAYDPKLQREVALKEVRPDLLDAEATRRLVAEARAMAKLSHANVVSVYDVEESPSNTVVLVMEYVAGQTLRQWLRADDSRSWRDVLDCFLAAGRGLMAAHGAGLMHRDFKPSNVLVAHSSRAKRAGGSIDDQQVKVTDFGLAKMSLSPTSSVSVGGNTSNEDSAAAGPQLPSEASGRIDSPQLPSEASGQMDSWVVGTPRYMAPEQHQGYSLTPAADQYAFCVALWEALCGEPPFSGKSMADDKAEGPPPWPMSSVPRPIADAVCRGLAPAPTERWPSMEMLLQALARDPAQRRKRWLLGSGAAALVGISGVLGQSWLSARAARCTGAEDQLVGIWDHAVRQQVKSAVLGVDRSHAPVAWERTRNELDGYADAWSEMHAEACEATTVRGEQSASVMDLRMACLHRAAVDLEAAATELAAADEDVVDNAHRLTAGLRPLERCADIEALQSEVEPPLPEDAAAVEEARARLAGARAAFQAGRYASARNTVAEAKEIVAATSYGPVRTQIALVEGINSIRLGDFDAAQSTLDEALGLASQWKQRTEMAEAATALIYVLGYRQGKPEQALRYVRLAAGLVRGQPRLQAGLHSAHGSVLAVEGNHAEAEAEHRRALALREPAFGPDHPEVLGSQNNIAQTLFDQGRYVDAEAVHRSVLASREKKLGSEHPDVATSRNNLALAMVAQGKNAEAEAETRRVIALLEKTQGPDHPDVATSRTNLSAMLHRQGKHADAEAEHRKAMALRYKVLGPDHPDIATSHDNLGVLLRAQGRFEEAEAEHRRALAIREKTLASDHPDVALSHANLGLVLHEREKLEEAEVEHRRAVTLAEKAPGPIHPNLAAFRSNLAVLLSARDKSEEAEAEYRRALELQEKLLDADDPNVARTKASLARLLLRRDRVEESLVLAEQAWHRVQRGDIQPADRGRIAILLADALWASKGGSDARRRARQLAQEALEAYGQAEGVGAEEADEAKAWLAAH